MPRFANQLTVAIAAQVALLGVLPQEEIRTATFRFLARHRVRRVCLLGQRSKFSNR